MGRILRHISVLFCLPILVALTGCGTKKPECDFFQTRNAVLRAISDDHGNRLGVYAAKSSDATKNGPVGESDKPLCVLGDKMITNSTSLDKRTLKCSGAISATVAGTKASKEIDFTVQQADSGEVSVSVKPFQF